MPTTIITITPGSIRPGDVWEPRTSARTVASVTRNMSDLCAYLVTFTDGSFFHAHGRQYYPIARGN